MAKAKCLTTGFKVRCPYCSDVEATITLDLNNLHVLTCTGCEQEFCAGAAVKEIEAELARWKAVEAWIDQARAMLAAPETDDAE